MTDRDPQIRIGVDIGGTFTDVVLSSAGRLVYTAKVLTTYDNFVEAISRGLDMCLDVMGESAGGRPIAATVIHGTTLVSNAYVERKGAPVTLIATAGFKDVLEMSEAERFDVHDLNLQYAPPFVSREGVIEVGGRMGHEGKEIEPLPLTAASSLQGRLKGAVAIALLNSYANPAHEQELAQQLQNSNPEIELSISSEVARTAGEYARTLTTVANAFAQPLVAPYLLRLEDQIQRQLGPDARFMMMLSNGGLCPAATARKFPVRIVESGPAAGVTAAHQYLSGSTAFRHLGPSLICLDMGGTTAKIAFVDTERPLALSSTTEVARDERHREGSGLTLLVPSLDLIEIGAGGGSIAQRDQLGLITVGPESAASEPGPAAYGRGGRLPTVTDANVVLGYLPPWQRLGGVADIFPDLAEGAVASLAGAGAGREEVEQLALGVHRIANEHMAGAVRVAAAYRGLQPEDYALLASGGAAPLHVCGVAEQLGIRTVVVPPEPGVFSSVGLVLAPEKYEASRPFRRTLPLQDEDYPEAREALKGMVEEIESALSAEDVEFTVSLDMRFLKQQYMLALRFGADIPASDVLSEAFNAEYLRLYRQAPDAPVEIVNLKLEGVGAKPNVELRTSSDQTTDNANPEELPVVFQGLTDRTRSVKMTAKVTPRLGTMSRGEGPALITESHTTTVIPPGWSWERMPDGALIVRRDQEVHS